MWQHVDHSPVASAQESDLLQRPLKSRKVSLQQPAAELALQLRSPQVAAYHELNSALHHAQKQGGTPVASEHAAVSRALILAVLQLLPYLNKCAHCHAALSLNGVHTTHDYAV